MNFSCIPSYNFYTYRTQKYNLLICQTQKNGDLRNLHFLFRCFKEFEQHGTEGTRGTGDGDKTDDVDFIKTNKMGPTT